MRLVPSTVKQHKDRLRHDEDSGACKELYKVDVGGGGASSYYENLYDRGEHSNKYRYRLQRARD